MGCRAIDDYSEYVIKYIPYFGIYDEIVFPDIDSINKENLSSLLNQIEGKEIIKQAIVQQYNEILIYSGADTNQRNILAPQCGISYDKHHNLPSIIYPKFEPLIDEEDVWKVNVNDLHVLLGTKIEQMGISFSDYKQFIDGAINLCEWFGLREDDITLNPSNIGYHPIMGLRIIDYGLTEDNTLI